MSKYSIQEFIRETRREEEGAGFFELETPRILRVYLDQLVWAKLGSMTTYQGAIKFQRERFAEHGAGRMFKKALTSEGNSLMKAEGRGELYLADNGKRITILDLQKHDTIVVKGEDLLAFEPSIQWDIKLMRKVAGMMSGGLFYVTLEGPGVVAITSHFEPLTMAVTKDRPVMTDPSTTVAWSGHLQPEIRTDITFRTFIGRGSGESLQMEFKGEGFVIVQSAKE